MLELELEWGVVGCDGHLPAAEVAAWEAKKKELQAKKQRM